MKVKIINNKNEGWPQKIHFMDLVEECSEGFRFMSSELQCIRFHR